MELAARFNKKSQGYSLIEVLAALLLLTVVLLALMQSVVLYTQTNMTNILRDEGVRVTQDVLYDLRTRGFDNVAVGNSTTTQRRSLRSMEGGFKFTTVVTVALIDPRMKSAQATTTWRFLGSTFTHHATTMIPLQDKK